MKFATAIALGAAALPGALAWGSLGHITVAYVATNLAKPETTAYFQDLLGNSTQDYLAGVATWADTIRYTKWGHFTGVFHFIDAKDYPPANCSVDLDRDCKEAGCVVTAFQNYTARLSDLDLAKWERAQAAKFVIHFVGDVHQPLHDEDVARGGNGISVRFDGTEWNLHHVWDSSIAEALIGAPKRKPYDAARGWADELTAAIRGGKFAAESKTWAVGMSLDDPIETALAWARQGNAYVCTHVLPEGPLAIVDQELGTATEYYQKAAPVIEVQVARAGYRLATWLDLVAANLTKPMGEL